MNRVQGLEQLRGFAALFVVAHHLTNAIYEKVPLYLAPLRFGQEAVMLFFAVSGFVIHLSVQRSAPDLRSYLYARFIRIYPIFIASLLIAYLAECIVARGVVNFPWPAFAGNLLMLQDRSQPGSIIEPFMGNAALWSLSYEWAFYLLYPLIVLLPDRRRGYVASLMSAVFLALLVISPFQIWRFLAYFLIWWSGVELCSVIVFGRPSRGLWVCIGTMAVIVAILGMLLVYPEVSGWAKPKTMGEFPILEIRHFASAIFALGLLAMLVTGRGNKLNALLKPFAYLAPMSYALYAIHYPIIIAVFSFKFGTIYSIIISLALSVLLSYVLELKLQPLLGTKKPSKRMKTAVPNAVSVNQVSSIL